MADSLRKADNCMSSTGATPVVMPRLPNMRQLASSHQDLDEAETIHIVAHSMGNLVVRHYLERSTDEVKGLKPDPRIKRMVMVGPPNQGAQYGAAVFVHTEVSRKSNRSFALEWPWTGKN